MSIDDEFALISYNIFDECDKNGTTTRKDGEWFSICFVLLIIAYFFYCLPYYKYDRLVDQHDWSTSNKCRSLLPDKEKPHRTIRMVLLQPRATLFLVTCMVRIWFLFAKDVAFIISACVSTPVMLRNIEKVRSSVS